MSGVSLVAMKHINILSILCAASLLGGGTSVLAQADEHPGGPPAFAPGHNHPPGKKCKCPSGRDNVLSPDEGQRLRAAREKASADPTIRSLREQRDAIDAQLVKSMNAAVLAADPSLAPVLEKVQNARKRARDVRDGFNSLTPEQRDAFKKARQAIKDDPTVAAARAKLKDASTPEAKHQAEQDLHAARKAALLKQNPALAPLLEKLEPPRGKRRGPPAPPVAPDEEN